MRSLKDRHGRRRTGYLVGRSGFGVLRTSISSMWLQQQENQTARAGVQFAD